MDPALIAAVALVVVIAAVSWANRAGNERSQRERIANVRTIPLDPTTRDHARAELANGKKIQAIKILRDHTGLGLAEAKALGQAMEGGHIPPDPASQDTDEDQSGAIAESRSFAVRARELRDQGRDTDAIRLLCDEAGMSIAEAQKFLGALG